MRLKKEAKCYCHNQDYHRKYFILKKIKTISIFFLPNLEIDKENNEIVEEIKDEIKEEIVEMINKEKKKRIKKKTKKNKKSRKTKIKIEIQRFI